MIANFPNSMKDLAVKNINGLAVRDPDNQNPVIFRRRKVQNVGKTHVAGDDQSIFLLRIPENFIIAFSLQTHIADVHSVKTRVTENTGCGTGNIFVCDKTQTHAVTQICSSARRRAA